MAARFSANGKRIGRPPKNPAPTPTAAAAAQTAGATPKFANRYDAAGRGRRVAGWMPPSSGPNLATAGLQTIRNRARDSTRNDAMAESAIQKWTSNMIGIGITPRFKRVTSQTRKQHITDLWNDFVKRADADCVLDLYGMQTLVVRAWLDSGEVFARRRNRFIDEDGLPVPMQVQILEADMVPLLDSDNQKGLPQNHRIRSGIEFNKRGRRVAYWFYKEHPGDKMFDLSTLDPDALVRVAASEVCHVFEQKRPGQLRGVSTLASVLLGLRNEADYVDATLERQKLANLYVGFISRQLPSMDPNDPLNGALTGQPYASDNDTGEPLLPLKPGLFQELDDGQKMEWSNPPEAGTNYSDYLRTSRLATAAGSGLPYEIMSGDIREISDRTLRVIINDFRRFAEQRQWQIVIPQFCQRVVEWFAEASMLAGEITIGEIEDVVRCEHAPHGWEYIHPVQDVQGKVLEMANGIRSRSSVIGARGDDPEAVDQERAADKQREIDLDLFVDPLGAAAAPTDEPSDPPDPEDDNVDDTGTQPNAAQTQAMHLAMLQRIEAETDALRAKAAQAKREPTPAPAPAADPLDEKRLALHSRILDLLGEDGDGGQQ